MKNEPLGHCYKCNVMLDSGEKICGTCQDDTDGRSGHLFQIKYEEHINKESNNGKKKDD